MSKPGISGGDRARRLVAIMGQLGPDKVIRIADLAAEVGATEDELAADLLTLSMCGVAPYYPDDLLPLIVEDGYVEVFGTLPALKGPVRLSASEASALAAALQAAGFTAEDDLPARLLEATGAAGFEPGELERTIRAATSAHEADVYEALARAVQEHGVVHIEYVRAGTEDASSRDIEPVALFGERGAWYVTAWCRKTGDWRTFRVDRIRSAGMTGDIFEPRRHSWSPGGTAAFSADGLPVAVLRFSAGEVFDEREWPGGRVAEQADDGSLTAEVPYGGTDWIARRIVARLGAVEAISPNEVRAAVRELAVSPVG